MAAPDIILQLVQRFEQNRLSYHSGKYNEAQLRQEFLNPFFKVLGWDVNNEQGYAEAYKEVIYEDSLEVEGATKAPDYAFRIGGTRKFFVEAKKPAVNIEYDIHPAFQLRRYAWSAKLPLSILTDFEEFAVYESRTKPDKSDSAATGRVMLLNYRDYPARWDELVAIFSRDAILKGSFDQFAEGLKGKRGTTEVDDAFLAEIEGWRDMLARNIALRNPDLQVRELNYAVQMTIDRIVFLRICEDRGIEREGQLQDLLEGEGVYARLCQLFRQADNRYNSGLFHFAEEKGRFTPQDNLTLHLVIDDKVLKEIISGLYYPGPYVFREIPADILGQVYERFLGKVIRLTAGHQAKVEEKPEVRKAGGVYYTPTYIVDYIVKNTVGKLLEGKTPREATSLKILDPACGSGSFLLGAYQYLLDWHTKWYSEHDPEALAKAKTPVIYQTQAISPSSLGTIVPAHSLSSPKSEGHVPSEAEGFGGHLYPKRSGVVGSRRPEGVGSEGSWKLTTSEKKRILLANIHGVDIDPQAVEVTKLSLSLKVLEGESQETIGAQLGLFKQRALPDLGRNIQCGNSLIGPDYFEGRMFPDEEEHYRVNPFNWQAAFPQVFIAGGFDVVIGNPPYIDSEWLTKTNPKLRDYCNNHYKSAKGNWDIFCIFIEKALTLCRNSGLSSMIVPNKIFSAEYARALRAFLSDGHILVNVQDYSSVPVFPVAVYPIVYVFKVGTSGEGDRVTVNKMIFDSINGSRISEIRLIFWKRLVELKDKNWSAVLGSDTPDLTGKILSGSILLKDVANVSGAATVSEAYKYKELIHEASSESNEECYKFVNTGTIDRYAILWGIKPTTYIKSKLLKPIISKHSWKSLSETRNHQSISKKIIIGGMTKLLECVYDSGGILAGKSTTIVMSNSVNLLYLLGILNSKLLTYYYKLAFSGLSLQGGFYRIGPPQIKELPIRVLHSSDPHHKKIVSLVERMLSLYKQSPRTPQEKEILQRDIASTDQAIDSIVYQLYGLTAAEIKIVEGH